MLDVCVDVDVCVSCGIGSVIAGDVESQLRVELVHSFGGYECCEPGWYLVLLLGIVLVLTEGLFGVLDTY